MTHLDEGRLRTLLDVALSEGDAEYARGHLDGCDTCQALLAELQEASAVISVALRHLDTVDAPTGAKDSVLARVGGGLGEAWPTPSTSTAEPTPASTPDLTPAEPEAPRRAAPSTPHRFTFARAAILVLFFGAVVATALPASPVRGWIAAGWHRAAELFTGTAQDESAALPADSALSAQTSEFAGVRLEVETGELLVLLQDIEPGTELDVRFVDGFQAAAFAAQPARFRTADGRIEVIGASGRVRLDIPRSVDVVSIQVNGRMYIRKAGDVLDVTGPIVTQTPGEIRFRVQ